MANLKTTFAGLELRNPIVAASCGLSSTLDGVVKLEQAGVGAVVLKSLFEENIVREIQHLSSVDDHTEAADYLQGYMRAQRVDDYIRFIGNCKSKCSIPIIASICCHSRGEWMAYARAIEKAGADGLELNVMGLCARREYNNGDYEKLHCDIVREVKNLINIPIIVKLGANITNPVALTERLKAYGASAVVCFNRPFQTDIDVDTMRYVSGKVTSNPSDLSNPLRWVGLISASVKGISFALSGGVHTYNGPIKAILAGANAVEVCSVLYEQGDGWVAKALENLEQWMDRQGFESVEEFCGRMNASDSDAAEQLERVQFLKFFSAK
ncbi:MAG: dihydroorotate dehydrogenase-like protein [Alistipes sp.]|nr:dihydroorotate dehydrogenase-like protein [Alistipes sp.]